MQRCPGHRGVRAKPCSKLFVYPSAWPEHLVWGSILRFLLTRGAGAISADRLIGLEPAETGDTASTSRTRY